MPRTTQSGQMDALSVPALRYAAIVLGAGTTPDNPTFALPAAADELAYGILDEAVARDNANVGCTVYGEQYVRAASAFSVGDALNVADSSGRLKRAVGSATINPSGANNSLLWTAKAAFYGQRIYVAYIDPKIASFTEEVRVNGNNIEVWLATNGGAAITSTGDTIKTSVAAHTLANSMVTVVDAGADDGSAAVTAMPSVELAGAANVLARALQAATNANDEVLAFIQGGKA